jgi:MFS transporter, PPP family, 3-phenylpropionic acid transporter
MGLLVRHVPLSSMATAQGYLAACSGIVTSIASILCGAAYAQYGQRVYLGMAAMAAVGSVVMWLARRRVANHPHNSALGG